jgi:hypothetical protein
VNLHSNVVAMRLEAALASDRPSLADRRDDTPIGDDDAMGHL